MSIRTVYNHPVFQPHEIVPPKPIPPVGRVTEKPPTLGELLFWPIGDFWKVQLGFVNLLCATHLPDTADLDIVACLNTLDQWTQRVKAETARCISQYHRDPASYGSEARFRAMMMVTVVQQDFGVHYNADAIKTETFKSSREGFLHGLLTGDKTGTCANTPVLYIAIGRKLGYPLYLVQAKGHLFCRWRDAKTGEKFNIEASGRGMTAYPDDHYMEWPHRITDREMHAGFYLKDLDPAEELGAFMATRGHCLQDKGHLLDAIVAYSHAHRLMPTDPSIFGFLLSALNKELALQKDGKLPMSYGEAENWDKAVNLHRFTLNTNYTTRVAGVNGDDNNQGRTIARNG